MPRFVLLDHDHPAPHLDFMLETGSVLWTWRLAAVPKVDVVQQATRIPDHRIAYLDYVGPVSAGRGHVCRRDGGEFTWVEHTEDRLVISIRGKGLHGQMTISRQSETDWTMAFEPTN